MFCRARWCYFLLFLSLSEACRALSLSVVFSGLTPEQEQNVEALVEIANLDAAGVKQTELTRLFEIAPLQIKKALQPLGLYDVHVAATLSPTQDKDDGTTAQFVVSVGAPVKITELGLALEGTADNDQELLDALSMLPLSVGDVFDHQHYEQAKQWLVEQAVSVGYLDAQLSLHRVEVDPAKHSAVVRWRLAPGPLYRFGAVEFKQNLFSDAHMQGYRVIEPGTRYRRDVIARQRSVLSASGYFSDVMVSPGPIAASENPAHAHNRDDPNPPLSDAPGVYGRELAAAQTFAATPYIPVTISLTPMRPNRIRGQLGWGTETGAGARVDWTRRHIGDSGHYFNLGGTVVQERSRIAGDFRYFIPLNPQTDESIEIGIRHESKTLTFADVGLQEGGETRIATSLASVFWRPSPVNLLGLNTQWSLGLNYTRETYDVFEVLFGNLPGDTQSLLQELIGAEAYATLAPDFYAVVPELRLSLRHADDPLFIRRGDFLGLQVLGASEDLGSNSSFWQTRLTHWSILPAGERGRVLLRSAIGHSEVQSRNALDVTFNQMPEFYEFRAGGARNVRGYAFETLIPEDGITGGKHQIVASVEYEHRVSKDFSAAVFVDAGDAFNQWQQLEENVGVGLGVRWRSPFGPARLDLGFPLDDADDAFQIYITVGPEF